MSESSFLLSRRSSWSGAPLSDRSRPATPGIPKADAKDWIQLFNGENLDGWTPKFAKHDLGENFNDTFRVENGLLEVRYDKWHDASTASSGTCSTRSRSRYYVLAAEYRFVGEQVKGAGPSLAWAIRNNGLMLHCARSRRRC